MRRERAEKSDKRTRGRGIIAYQRERIKKRERFEVVGR
jgi:hypothetical protein